MSLKKKTFTLLSQLAVIGYLSNALTFSWISQQSVYVSEIHREQVIMENTCCVLMLDKERRNQVLSQHWFVPQVDVAYNVWIPFVVISKYSLYDYFDVRKVNSHEEMHVSFAVFYPLYSTSCSYWESWLNGNHQEHARKYFSEQVASR